VYSTPSLKVIPAECRNANSDKKTRVMGLPGGERSEMTCVGTISECDRQTDGPTQYPHHIARQYANARQNGHRK